MKSANEIQENKKDFKSRLETIGWNQRKLAKSLKVYPQQLTQALNGEQPGLLKKAMKKLSRLERRRSKKEQTQIQALQ